MAELEVWISERGQKYHAHSRCQGLQDGQRKTIRGGGIARRVRRVHLCSVGDRTPCTVCWHQQPGWTDWSNLEHQVQKAADSRFEVEFFEHVLRRIPGVRPADVRVQERFAYDHFKQGRIDFTIKTEDVKLAIELDGLRKSPVGRPVNTQRHTDASRRQNALTNQGWKILRFTNEELRLDPDRCRAEIERCLRRSRPERQDDTGSTRTADRPTQGAGTPRWEAEADTSSGSASSRSADSGPTGLRTSPSTSNSTSKKPSVLMIVAAGMGAAVLVLLLLLTSRDKSDASSTSPDGTNCPAEFPVKGNESISGELIYHEPGWEYFARTRPERCFTDGGAAEKAGFRPSRIR